MSDKFRIKFKTRDGSIVMNREANREYYLDDNNRIVDHQFMDISLKKDASEKGVRIVGNYDVTCYGITCTVEWLSKK
jgi:hypothetical protein